MISPNFSSKYGASHPPCGKPFSRSSSGPPGACITPSRVTKAPTTTFIIFFTPSFKRLTTGRLANRAHQRSLGALAVHAGSVGSPGQAAVRGLSPSSRDTFDDRESHGRNDPRELEARSRVELPELGFGSLTTGQQREHVQIHPLRG